MQLLLLLDFDGVLHPAGCAAEFLFFASGLCLRPGSGSIPP